MNAVEQYNLWLSRLEEGDPEKEELLSIRDNEAEITDRFYQEIEFGTAGLRGICGAGTNRMNVRTVGRATQGIADYILESGEDISRGVVIAYDCRYHSKEFSELAASILAGNGIRAFLFPELRPTPELSFAIRHLNAISGINMTASHNPKEYNGYKVYWKDGAQISGEVSNGMMQHIQALDLFDRFKALPLEEAKARGLIVMLGEEMDRTYLDYVLSMSMRKPEELDLSVSIVYTPLNGAGSIPVRQVLAARGFTNFRLVEEQQDPDPEFSTVGYPNPEDPRGFALAEKLGKETGAELLIATDPDSDRMAIEVPDGNGNYIPLNGNQTGALIIAYMAQAEKESGRLPQKPVMIKSIVTGELGQKVCEHYGIDVYEALTGFKNICGRIPELTNKGYTYFFGYEESIGCAPGEQVRDKDGICAAMLVSEMAAWYKKRGMTVMEGLEELYGIYGCFAEEQVSVVLKGSEGAARIRRIMDVFRLKKPVQFGALTAAKIVDYIDGYEDIPASNVMKFLFSDGVWFAMRPSGTEPKIKFYYYAKAGQMEEARQLVHEMKNAVSTLVDSVK